MHSPARADGHVLATGAAAAASLSTRRTSVSLACSIPSRRNRRCSTGAASVFSPAPVVAVPGAASVWAAAGAGPWIGSEQRGWPPRGASRPPGGVAPGPRQRSGPRHPIGSAAQGPVRASLRQSAGASQARWGPLPPGVPEWRPAAGRSVSALGRPFAAPLRPIQLEAAAAPAPLPAAVAARPPSARGSSCCSRSSARAAAPAAAPPSAPAAAQALATGPAAAAAAAAAGARRPSRRCPRRPPAELRAAP